MLIVKLMSIFSVGLGICEGDYTPHCSLLAISEADGAVALTCKQDTCEEDEDGDETVRHWEYTMIRDFAGKVVVVYPKLPGVKHIDELAEATSFPVDDPGSEGLEAWLTKHAFTPPRTFELGTCRLAIRDASARVAKRKSATDYEFELRVRRGKDTFFKKVLGTAVYLGEKTHAAEAWTLSGKRALVYYTTTTAAGPPPGYFGEDDEGSQYVQPKEHVMVIDLSAVPEVGVCFPAPTP